MKTSAKFAWPALLWLCACSKESPAPTDAATPSEPAAHAEAAASASSAPSASASDAPSAASAAPAASAVPLPERPVPKNVTLVRMNMPPEVQMKAVAYMAAMRAPQPGDPLPDADYLQNALSKLANTSRAVDRGGDKATWNRTELSQGNRQIDLWMSQGCQADTPKKLGVQVAPLSTWHAHGLLVLRCNDKKQQCLQSTRDPQDVLCTSAPRRTP